MTHEFESLAAFGRAVAPHIDGGNSGWTGETARQSLGYALNGNTSLVAEATKLMDKLDAEIETATRQWEPSVAGMFPSVPDYIQGHPESMRRLGDCSSESAPLRVYVCTTSSAGVDWQDLQKRGIAVLAAVMALCQSRPVELWVFTALDGNRDGDSCFKVRINSAPLQLSEACVALTSVGYDRNLTHQLARVRDGFTGGWARTVRNTIGDEVACTEACRKLVGAEETDLIVPPATCHFTEIVSNPVNWVRGVLERYGQLAEA